jgi:hypothetical protein
MLTNNAKTLETDTTDYLPDSPSNGRKPVSPDNRPNNVLPLERPKYNTGKLKLTESVRLGTGDSKSGTVNETETVEIKSRIEAVLERMKSRAATSDSPDSAETAGAGMPGEELERRRAAIIAIAREAEVHSREAADKFREAEARFKEETELRLLAEQQVIQIEEKLRQIEEESKQWLETAQAEETKRIEVEKAKAELEARLKQEAKTRELAEQSRDEAEDKLKIAERALDSAKKAWKEAEAKAHAAEEAARAAESLIYEADAIARKAEEKFHAAEASLQRESELRVLAEQMLKELASASPHLELNFENLGAALSQAGSLNPAARISKEDQSALEELRAQIEAEQKSRIVAEQSRADAESKAQELEAKLRKADEKFRTTENGYKKVLRKQEEELRSMSEQVVRNNESGQFAAQTKSEGDDVFMDSAQPDAKTKLKLVSYGVFITLLALALAWLGVAAYQQL